MLHSRRTFLSLASGLALSGVPRLGAGAETLPAWLEPYREPAARIIGASFSETFAWRRLAELTDTFGPRLSGSPALEDAIQWALRQMRADSLDRVRSEPVMVTHWVRGQESLEVLAPYPGKVAMLGLGNSVGTAPEGIEAPLIVVSGFEELDSRRAEAAGSVVLLNVPYTDYFSTVGYRTTGASRVGRVGALAALVRSVGLDGLRTPHTGVMVYQGDGPRVPAAAVSVEDASRLARLAARGPVHVRLTMGAQMLPDAQSSNVVAEIRGRDKPDEFVVVGGHLDSWDVGTGAVDDGGGCIVTWEALRLMRALNLRPRRTVRLVLFVNEENGLRGALAYRDQHKTELANHVLMLESDSGVFRPRGFGFTGAPEARSTLESIALLLRCIGTDRIGPSGGGPDIGPSVAMAQIPAMSLETDESKYFLYHHTAADTVDKLDPLDMARCAAAVAIIAYVVADLPQRIGEPLGTR